MNRVRQKRFDRHKMKLLGYPNPGKNFGLSGLEQKKVVDPQSDHIDSKNPKFSKIFFRIF